MPQGVSFELPRGAVGPKAGGEDRKADRRPNQPLL